MFERVHQLRKKSNAFVANMPVYVAESIEQSEKELVKLNQKQLQASKDLANKSLSTTYSAAYARKKGYKKPDGYLSGKMYSEMFVDANENDNTFSMFSFAPYTKYFADRYGDVFGIGDMSLSQAQKIVMNRFRMFYVNKVIRL